MKEKLSGWTRAALMIALMVLSLGGCRLFEDKAEEGGDYDDFYNYPDGRTSPSGLLTVGNKIAKEVLLFIGTVDGSNYIGTVGPLGSVTIKLPDNKFYTIVAVEKSNYEERKAQAAQFSTLTYHSATQAYTISVSPASTYGGGNWVFNNNTAYWVQVKSADLSQNYAVIAPNAQRVIVPINIGSIYDYVLYFSRELKYNGIVIAMVETSDPSQGNTAQATNEQPTFTTNIIASNLTTATVKPGVMVINNSTKTVRVYSANNQKSNGAPGGDFVIVGGTRQMITGFEADDNTNTINFSAIAWQSANRYVPVDMTMALDKVYEIIIPVSEAASEITVTEVDATKYYN
jgi:hypothetical protein